MSKVGFIGGGALAESIVRGICGKTFAPSDIFISEIRAARCEELSERYGVNASTRANFSPSSDKKNHACYTAKKFFRRNTR